MTMPFLLHIIRKPITKYSVLIPKIQNGNKTKIVDEYSIYIHNVKYSDSKNIIHRCITFISVHDFVDKINDRMLGND